LPPHRPLRRSRAALSLVPRPPARW